MTYLIVGLDRRTLRPWHGNVTAADAAAAKQLAVDRAQARGIDLRIAAVIGPGPGMVPAPMAA